MKKKTFACFVSFFIAITGLQAQNRLSIDKVYSTYLRNSGTIVKNKQIKGYFFLYRSDKIDRRTNEYTLQILDENLNKVRDIKFEDSKKLSLLEAAYNGKSLAFLFKNENDKTLDMKVYGIDGKLKYTYTNEYDRKTDDLMERYATIHTDEGTNQTVYNLGEQGYASILPLRDGRLRTYRVDFYSSATRKQWTYNPTDEEHYANPEFIGSTDSLIFLLVTKKRRMLSGDPTSHLIGINYITKKEEFDLDSENGEYKFVATGMEKIKGTGNIMVYGNYYNNEDDIYKDNSMGIAVYTLNSKGKILDKKYNSWTEDLAKYLPINKRGKVDDLGYVFIHRVLQMPDGKTFVVGEGYKRQASAGGIALNVLAGLGGGKSGAGVTKIVTTEMVLFEFDDKFKITNATIYEKANNTAEFSSISDFGSQHAIALYLKMKGSFDYEFTTGDIEYNHFSVCYSDWVRKDEYKGKTFNAIHYNGSKFSTDKLELKSKANSTKVFPAKPGSIMIMEYFKKDKRLEFRLEKLG